MANKNDVDAFSLFSDRRYEEAFSGLEKLAERGDIYALNALAWMYENGLGVTTNFENAKRYYNRAMTSGSCDAALRLGVHLEKKGDITGAKAAFENGVQLGSISCSYRLGLILLENARDSEEVKLGRDRLDYAARQGNLFAQRSVWSYKWAANGTIFSKFILICEFLSIVTKTLIEAIRNPSSEKIH